MPIARFLGSWPARQDRHQWRLPLAEPVERRVHIFQLLETIHALGSSPQFSWSLGSSQQQDAQNRNLTAVEVEYLLEAVLVLCDPAVGAAGWPRQSLSLQGFK